MRLAALTLVLAAFVVAAPAWAQVPSSLRVVHRVWWRRRYERAFGAGVPAMVPGPGSGFAVGLAAA